MDNSNPLVESPTVRAEPSKRPKSFWRPFGRTSLALGVGSIFVPWVFSIAIVPASETVQSREDAKMFLVVATITLLLATAFGLGAFVLGLLSLFGFGKQDGKSHRVAGFFGLLIGGFMIAVYSLMPLGIIAARKAAANKANEQIQQGALEPYRHLETKSQFSKPSNDWILHLGDDAKSFNSSSVAVITKKTSEGKSERMGILIVEPLPVNNLGVTEELDLERLAKLHAEEMSLSDKTVESIVATDFNGHEAAKFTVTGLSPGADRVRCSQLFVSEKGYLFQVIAIGQESGAIADDPEFTLIHNSLKLPAR